MMSRAWAVAILATAVVVGREFGCRAKPELHGRPCTREGHECGPVGLRPGHPGEVCVIVYSDEHFDCTGEGYCAPRCDEPWETCTSLPSAELRERCLEYARLHNNCPPGLVCKSVPTECDPSGLPHTHELSSDSACVPENVYPNKAPARRSSCSFSPP